MMMSPESFIEENIRGKSPEEMLTAIHKLERDIDEVLSEIENGTGRKEIDPSPETQLVVMRKYLALAMKEYQSMGDVNRVTRIRYNGPSCFSLTNEQEYDVISVEKDWYRIIDNSKEDYLFDPDEFTIVKCQCELNGTIREIREFGTVLLKDGRIAAVTDILAPDCFLVDVGSSEEDWDNITAYPKDIEDVLYAAPAKYVCIDYLRETKEKADDGRTWIKSGEHTEQLLIDREKATISYKVQLNENEYTTYSYHSDEGVHVLLAFFPSEYLCHIREKPKETVEDPAQSTRYHIFFRDTDELEHEVEGTYDLGGLPEYWGLFVNKVQSVMTSLVNGELFNRRFYEKLGRREFDLTVCQVVFETDGDEYSYICDDDSLKEGDKVLVPFGFRNRETIGTIVYKAYYAEDDTPYPMEKLKKIIKKVEE